MFAGMSAYSPFSGMNMAEGPSAISAAGGLSAVPIAHALDLAHLFGAGVQEEPEALRAETRRHLGGCLTAIETALRLAAPQGSRIAATLAELAEPICWPMLRAHPTLVSPALLSHMRVRAGVSLMLRQYGRPDSDRPDSIEAANLLPQDDPALGHILSSLALAEARWSEIGADDQPMRPDLPVEYYIDLLWIAVACLAVVLERAALPDGGAILPEMERLGHGLLARHDEAVGPIAVADMLVRQLGSRADEPELLGRALAQRRFLLFAALAGRRAHLPTITVIDILLTGAIADVAALCRVLGGSGGDYRHLLLSLRPVRPALTDAAVVAEADAYEGLDQGQAAQAVATLRAPLALRVKVDHLRRAVRA